MSTVIASSLPVSVEFRAQYVSQSLNTKMLANARGIVRGGYVVPSIVADQVLITPDPLTGDTVINGYGLKSLTGNDPYAVTYSTDASVIVPITANGALHFIYFEGGYAPLTTTNARLVDYTEAEFEAGTPDANGGVLLAVVQANGSAGSVIAKNKILTAGMSNGADVPFKRNLCSDFTGGQGFAPVRERVASRMDFGFGAAKRVPYGSSLSFTAGTLLEYVAIDTPVGNGAVHYAPVAADYANTVSFYGDSFDYQISDTLPRKARIEFIYKTNAGYVLNTGSSTMNLSIIYSDGSTGGVPNPLIAPTTQLPTAVSTDWSLFVTEFDLPTASGPTNVAGFYPKFALRLSGGQIWIASVSCVVSEQVLVPSELDTGDGSLTAVPASYGLLAGAKDFSLASQPSFATNGISVRQALSANSWTIRNSASQKITAFTNPTLYLAPDLNSANSHLYIGATGIVDLETAAAENRLSNVTITGSGQGTSATYQTKFTNMPLRVDEIRPNAGYGADAKRIDLRDSDGNNNDLPPPFLSSAGTAGATGILQFNGGTGLWVIYTAPTSYVNLASVSTSANTVKVVFDSAFANLYYIPFAMYRSGAAGSRDYFVQISGQTVTDFDIKIREAGTATPVSQNGDRIFFACFGRLA
jgi:hypothetical protein